jgi:hypothetical protein
MRLTVDQQANLGESPIGHVMQASIFA